MQNSPMTFYLIGKKANLHCNINVSVNTLSTYVSTSSCCFLCLGHSSSRYQYGSLNHDLRPLFRYHLT